jgi:hypothetical protein
MTDLDDRLRSLGESLALDTRTLTTDVLARLDEPQRRQGPGVLRVAAATVLVLAILAVSFPSSRRAVADWLGFDGVRIERRPLDDVPTTADSLERPGVGTIANAGGRDVLVSAFVGTLDNPALGKTLGTGSDVTEVMVDGALGLWIDGAPHEVSFLDADGVIVFEGFAGDTLLWQDGPLIRRLEGFDDVRDAVAYAVSLGTGSP